ncbi:MAG: glycine cleavage system protein GcvH [Caldilineaceae bacterium]|nr:glycine cleavage system protein GcvH [Caldilineaceae bacterium]MCB0188316.1 glycine cleavage system protein GcvH [Caldilineaceae bacterium]
MTNYKLDDKAKYAESHEWVRIEDGVAVVGISDAAQDQLSDVVYVDLPEEGRAVRAGEAIAVVESVKAAEDIYAPVTGTILAINEDLVDRPELVNEAPYESWFFKIQPSGDLDAELGALMDGAAYDAFVEESH